MFNQELIDVLTQVNGITNSLILTYPKTVASSNASDILVCFDVEELDSDKFEQIGFKDSLSEFLSLSKLFSGERKVSLEGNVINFSKDGITSSYITDNLALMDAYKKDPVQFEKTEAAPSVASFDLKVEDIKNIKSASGVFKDLSEVIITSQDGDIKLSLGATNKFNAKSNTYSLMKSGQTTKEFEIKIPVENFKMIPESEYKIEVKYNSARDSYRILLINKNLAGFKLLMSVKV